MKEKIKLLLVDDHAVTLIGIKNTVEKIDFVKVEGAVNSANEALELLDRKSIDIILTDIEMTEADEGIRLTKVTKRKYPNTKVIAITQHSEPWIISKLLKYNIDGIIAKSKTDYHELNEALLCIQSNKKYYSDDIKESFFQEKVKENKKALLTCREKEILILICQEYTTKSIAIKLSIAPSTIESHRKNMFIKLNVRSQAGLVREAIRHDFYKFE